MCHWRRISDRRKKKSNQTVRHRYAWHYIDLHTRFCVHWPDLRKLLLLLTNGADTIDNRSNTPLNIYTTIYVYNMRTCTYDLIVIATRPTYILYLLLLFATCSMSSFALPPLVVQRILSATRRPHRYWRASMKLIGSRSSGCADIRIAGKPERVTRCF